MRVVGSGFTSGALVFLTGVFSFTVGGFGANSANQSSVLKIVCAWQPKFSLQVLITSQCHTV